MKMSGFLIIVLMLLTGCVGSPYDHRYTTTGALAGATGGALLGHSIDRNGGALIGGTTGALLGGTIGYQFDRGHHYDDRGHYRRHDRHRDHRYEYDRHQGHRYNYDRHHRDDRYRRY